MKKEDKLVVKPTTNTNKTLLLILITVGAILILILIIGHIIYHYYSTNSPVSTEINKTNITETPSVNETPTTQFNQTPISTNQTTNQTPTSNNQGGGGGTTTTTTTSGGSSEGGGGGGTTTCTENWQCSVWSICIAGTQTRTCIDLNSCGTENNKPAGQQSCTSIPIISCDTDAECENNRGPGFICNEANNCEWIPPIGIPKPEFGIEESYRMYDDPVNRNPELTYHQNAEGGFYTHYVDNSGSCTDTNNPYGSETIPRCTIPYSGLDSKHHYIVPIDPGVVMEVHGIHNVKEIRENGWLHGYLFTGGGTKEKPAFIRSSLNNPAVITTSEPDHYGSILNGSHIILENFEFNNSKIGITASNSAMRNCEVHSIERVNGRAVSISSAKDFVFYNNEVHHNWGTWPDGSKDMHDVTTTGFSERVWVVDNELHHASYNINGTVAKTGGDAIQVMGSGCATLDNSANWPSFIYIARNKMHHNTENSVDIKCSHNVVISQNEASWDGFTPYSSASMINHENAHSTWFIFNKIHDVKVGVRPEDAKEEAYVIGNVIYNVKYPVSSGSIYGNFVGGVWARIVQTHIIGNTFYNVTGGALIPQNSGNCTIINNLVSRVQVPYPGNLSWYHAGVEAGRGACDRALIDYNLFHQPVGVEGYVPEGVIKLKWGSDNYEGLESFQTSIGQCLNCIEADPLFADSGNYNFSLNSRSPALDSGTNAGIVQEVMQKYYETFGESIEFDIEGNPRPQGNSWDIGAYEYEESLGSLSVQQSSIFSSIWNWFKGILTGNTIRQITGNFLKFS